MAISTITYAVDKVKTTWAPLETIMPATYNELNQVVKELVTNNNALQALLNLKAPLANPALTGVPTAPTAAKTVNNTQLATTAFVHLLAGAANNGGIVDSLLAQNGYVKFANGLIIQWGASGYAVTFPIAFNVVYNVLSIPQATASTSNTYWGRFYITALTKNGFNVSDTGADSNRWIAIGSAQPQWGKNSGNTTITFPLGFTTTCFGVLGTNQSNEEVRYNIACYSISETSFYMYSDSGSANFWLAIGQQQTK